MARLESGQDLSALRNTAQDQFGKEKDVLGAQLVGGLGFGTGVGIYNLTHKRTHARAELLEKEAWEALSDARRTLTSPAPLSDTFHSKFPSVPRGLNLPDLNSRGAEPGRLNDLMTALHPEGDPSRVKWDSWRDNWASTQQKLPGLEDAYTDAEKRFTRSAKLLPVTRLLAPLALGGIAGGATYHLLRKRRAARQEV